MSESTVPRPLPAQPLRRVRAIVLSGPDAGRTAPLEDAVLTIGTAEGNSLVVSDTMVSRFHLELRRGLRGIEVSDLGSTNGTLIDAVCLRGAAATVPPGTVLQIGMTRLSLEDGEYTIQRFSEGTTIPGLHGQSRAVRSLVTEVESIAGSDASVLLTGESGTGKELVARGLHALSARRDGPFVAVDAAALVPTLFNSELFGHVRGAFTGADRSHVGAFERAQGGTLFLDEIGELSPPVQAGLLGALERRAFRPVGGSKEVEVDLRVIAATHRNLRTGVNDGSFRLDLYYRLAVITIELPALRDRSSDVPVLVEHFVREAGFDDPIDRFFPEDVMTQLMEYRWPGNVRELRNLVERTLVVGAPPPVTVSAATRTEDAIAPLLELEYREARRSLLDEFERRYLVRLLDRTGGNVRAAARTAKMDRTYLTELIKRHDLK